MPLAWIETICVHCARHIGDAPSPDLMSGSVMFHVLCLNGTWAFDLCASFQHAKPVSTEFFN